MKNIEIENIDAIVGAIKLITLRTKHLEVKVCSYGAALYKMRYKGKDLVVSPESLDDFLVSKAYYGKTIGRHSGRLFGPNYVIDGKTYDVIVDENEPFVNHGGKQGLSFKNFTLTGYEHMAEVTNVTLHYRALANSDGFPGNLNIDVTYEVTKEDALKISYSAKASESTLCHLTNHLYLNIGNNQNDILDHILYVDSDRYLDIEKNYKIKGDKLTVGTPFDFRLPTRIGKRIKDVKQPDLIGYDHCFLLNKHDNQKAIVTLSNDETNLAVDVYTDYPAVVLYTHNHPAPAKLPGVTTNGVHSCIAIECQYPPDGIHYENLDSGILYQNQIEHKFIMIKPYEKK